MRKFAFIYSPSDGWVGGANYYISTIESLNDNLVSQKTSDLIYILTSPNADLSGIEKLERVVVIRTKLLSKTRSFSLAVKVIDTIIGRNVTLLWLLRSNKIDLLCHSFIPLWTGVRSLPWIPDFQQCYLPHYFSKVSLFMRNRAYAKYLASENVLLSSQSALDDAERFFSVTAKPWVYRFRPLLTHDYAHKKCEKLLKSNGLHGAYVFLPNQFWMHKNHKVVFEAAKLALQQGQPFDLVCTGKLSDFRNKDYPAGMLKYINDNGLGQHIKYLGLVDRGVFNCLLKGAEVLVNPSYFEGWSSTVEEGKALGKKMAISNLDVHREQVGEAEGVMYFNADSPYDCLTAIRGSLMKDSKVYSYDIQSDSVYEILDEIVPPNG